MAVTMLPESTVEDVKSLVSETDCVILRMLADTVRAAVLGCISDSRGGVVEG